MSEKTSQNNRWWERYLIRYLPGTVVSFFVLYILFDKQKISYPAIGELFRKVLSPGVTGWEVIVAGLISFTFCYISSAIVLMFHCYRYLGLNPSLYEFYYKLSEARNDHNGIRHEYVESYRDMREHGNAFFCVLTSLLFGASICCWKTALFIIPVFIAAAISIVFFFTKPLKISLLLLIPIAAVAVLFYFLFVTQEAVVFYFIILGTIAWFLATHLERKMMK